MVASKLADLFAWLTNSVNKERRGRQHWYNGRTNQVECFIKVCEWWIMKVRIMKAVIDDNCSSRTKAKKITV